MGDCTGGVGVLYCIHEVKRTTPITEPTTKNKKDKTMQKLFMIQSALNRLSEVGACNNTNPPGWVDTRWRIGDEMGNDLSISIEDEGFSYYLVTNEENEEEGMVESVTHLKELVKRTGQKISF